MGRRFLVVGSGGREHALAWKIGQSADVESVWVAPGNAGIAADSAIDGCVPIGVDDLEALAAFAESNKVDLTVIGPEGPLCAGVVDLFKQRRLPVFGPSKAAAELEASKAFSKEIMRAAGVRTADFAVFEQLESALAHVRRAPHPLVIKADGLAGGKGVVISEDLSTSETTLKSFMVEARFGDSSATVVIEDFLTGPELSFMIVTDGDTVVPLATSRDHKRLGAGDTGPNTGGMGAITPSPDTSRELEEEIIRDVIRPVLDEMRRRGAPFSGFLYAGLMLTPNGPYVLEFNVRMGDPETQPLLFALNTDLSALLLACASGDLSSFETHLSSGHACAVVLASKGYPTAPEKGHVISGLGTPMAQHTKVFHAGTSLDQDGNFINTGGRVLAVTSVGKTAAEAQERAYAALEDISWDGCYFRPDIGR